MINKIYKLLMIVLMLVGVFCLLIFITGMFMTLGDFEKYGFSSLIVALIFAFLGILLIFISYKKLKAKELSESKNNDNDITIEEFMKSTQIKDTTNKAKEPEEQKLPMDQIHKSTHKIQSHNFNIAGLYHYENDIINSLIDTNYYYDLNKQELIDEVGEDERVYEYDFESDKVELKDEPNNEYDPKAIAIYVDGIKIGYVKKGSTSRVRNLLKKDVTSIWIRIAGGKYKILEYDYDEDKYNLYKENEPVSLFGKITIDVRETVE